MMAVKIIGVSVIVILFLAMNLTTCSSQVNDQQTIFASQLKKSLHEASSGQIAISSLPMRDWDHLYIIPPYTPTEELFKCFGAASKEIQRTGIEARDDITVFVFKKSGQVAGIVEIPREICDFTSVSSLAGIIKKDAIFRLKNVEGRIQAQAMR